MACRRPDRHTGGMGRSAFRGLAATIGLSLIATVTITVDATDPAAAQAGTTTACGIAPQGYNVIESDAAVILGTAARDFICAGDAANRIHGGQGADIIHGGAGRNTIYGEAGFDSIHGGPDQDRIFGGGGDDTIVGGGARDVLRGGAGSDTILGGTGRDRLFGQDGDDDLFGNGGRDRIVGGDGVDAADGGRSTDYCQDTLYLRQCEKIIGLVEPSMRTDRVERWGLFSQSEQQVDISDDGQFVVFLGRRPDHDRLLTTEIIVRDMVSGKFTVIDRFHDPQWLPDTEVIRGVSISGDGTSVAYSAPVKDDPSGKRRIHFYVLPWSSHYVFPVPDGLEAHDLRSPELNNDGSAVLFEAVPDGGNSWHVAQSWEGAVDLLNEREDGRPETITRPVGFSDDGSRVLFRVWGGWGDPGWSPLAIRDGTTATTTFALSGVIGDRNAIPLGLRPDGRGVGAIVSGENSWPMREFVFGDLDTGETSTVDASVFCDGCAFGDGSWNGSWAAVEVVAVDDFSVEAKGIALIHPDGRTNFVLPDVEVIHEPTVTPNGGAFVVQTQFDHFRILYR